MKKTLTFQALPERPSGGLLLQLAVTLRQLDINPDVLNWIVVPPDGTLKVRLVLSNDDRKWIPAIADNVRQMAGVRDVKVVAEEDPAMPSDTPHLN